MTGDTTHPVRAIVRVSEKNRFNFVCKADLSVREAEILNLTRLSLKREFFCAGMLISADICRKQIIVVSKSNDLYLMSYLVNTCNSVVIVLMIS